MSKTITPSCCFQPCNNGLVPSDTSVTRFAVTDPSFIRRILHCLASRLKGDNGISIVIDGDTIIINGGEGFSNIVCVGGGACILSSNILPIIELKTIVAGTGITISDTAT